MRPVNPEITERNKIIYQTYMNNTNLSYGDLAKQFNLCWNSVYYIVRKYKRENNTNRVPKVKTNYLNIDDKTILEVFLETKSVKQTRYKLGISGNFILKTIRKYGYDNLIKKSNKIYDGKQREERNKNIWLFYVENKPKNYHIIAEKFNLTFSAVKKLMVLLKKENKHPLAHIPTKSKRIKKINMVKVVKEEKVDFYQKFALEKNIDVKNLFAY